ncbi:hypothetical protein [Nonomuraea sp. NPDC049158]|uniref:hypothetical protein n=1 Tax=Nonomuraea sp. NPDC049158 TaxID=3155649 RepID=UPI0033DE776D
MQRPRSEARTYDLDARRAAAIVGSVEEEHTTLASASDKIVSLRLKGDPMAAAESPEHAVAVPRWPP